jgi:hypothetical protein
VACRKAACKGPRNSPGHPPALLIMPAGRRHAWPTARPRASRARFTPLYGVMRHDRPPSGPFRSALTRGFAALRTDPLYGRQTAPQGRPEGITPGQYWETARGPILWAVFDHSSTRAARERTDDLNPGPISASVGEIGFLPGVHFSIRPNPPAHPGFLWHPCQPPRPPPPPPAPHGAPCGLPGTPGHTPGVPRHCQGRHPTSARPACAVRRTHARQAQAPRRQLPILFAFDVQVVTDARFKNIAPLPTGPRTHAHAHTRTRARPPAHAHVHARTQGGGECVHQTVVR